MRGGANHSFGPITLLNWPNTILTFGNRYVMTHDVLLKGSPEIARNKLIIYHVWKLSESPATIPDH